MIETIFLGAGSLLTSLIGDSIDAGNAKKMKRKQIDAYRRLLINDNEMGNRQDRAGDTVYTNTINELNKGALAGRGALNPEILRTIAYTKMASARANAENEQFVADDTYNRNINTQIAQIEATPEVQVNPVDAILEGVGGYLTGKQISMQEGLANKEMEFYDKMINGINDKAPLSTSDVFNLTKNFNSFGNKDLRKKKLFNLPKASYGLYYPGGNNG